MKSNDIIGEAQINLKGLLNDCSLVKKPLILNKAYYNDVLKVEDKDLKLKFDKDDDNKFWIPMRAKNKNGKIESRG